MTCTANVRIRNQFRIRTNASCSMSRHVSANGTFEIRTCTFFKRNQPRLFWHFRVIKKLFSYKMVQASYGNCAQFRIRRCFDFGHSVFRRSLYCYCIELVQSIKAFFLFFGYTLSLFLNTSLRQLFWSTFSFIQKAFCKICPFQKSIPKKVLQKKEKKCTEKRKNALII